MATNDHKDCQEAREPAHHARRPMNAFLIFCKRHRSSVRKEFPNLENRAVTRVLGDWWATLRPDQKRAYTNLAQEYKDAFLHANPDFKWYKLPAPPLRTLTTRPTNKKSEIPSNENNSADLNNLPCDSIDGSKVESSDADVSIQPGKLADESQIGGLSSLFTPQKNNGDEEGPSNHIENPPKIIKKQLVELKVDSQQRSKCKIDLFCNERINAESNNNEQHLLNEEDEKIESDVYLESNEISEESNYRGERSCKGLRYQQLMAEQQRNVPTAGNQLKRRRPNALEERPKERRNSMSSNVSEKTDSLSSEGANSTRSDMEHLAEGAEGNVEASKPEETETEGAESRRDLSEWPSYKRFKAEDFNLEKKIEALPSLSLEEFQERKKQQRTKKKKISQRINSSSAKKNLDSIDLQEDSEKSLLVGSKKRKARKESITRNAAATSASKSNQDPDGKKPWCASPDLEALACLAEIAANRTKLTK